MNHDEIKNQIFEFSDGECDGIEKGEIDHHLRRCQQCSAALQQWNHVKKILFTKPHVPDSPAFVERVMRQFDNPSSITSGSLFWDVFRRPAVWVPASVALGVVVFFLLKGPDRNVDVNVVGNGNITSYDLTVISLVDEEEGFDNNIGELGTDIEVVFL